MPRRKYGKKCFANFSAGLSNTTRFAGVESFVPLAGPAVAGGKSGKRGTWRKTLSTMNPVAQRSRNQKKNTRLLGIAATKKYTLTTNHTKSTKKSQYSFIPRLREGRRAHRGKTNTLHHEEHEGNEVNPGSAGRLTGFMHFAFGDQRLAVGSRPASRRWRIGRNNVLFAGETLTVQGSPLHPSSKTFLTDRITDILFCNSEYSLC